MGGQEADHRWQPGGKLPVRFDHFMDAALYGPNGFYATGRGAGTSRDFLTSPETGTLFGAVVARRIDAEWDRLGRPGDFTVIEVGAGPGTLARTIFAAAPRCADSLRYVLVDAAPGMRALHRADLPIDRVESRAELPSDQRVGLVIANELFDNVPVRLLRHDGHSGRWHDVWVSGGPSGSLVEQLLVADEATQRRADTLVPNPSAQCLIPLQENSARMLDAMVGSLSAGAVIAIDYTRPSTAEFASRAPQDWMRTYDRHVRGHDVLARPGECDITVDVALDQLCAIVGPPSRSSVQRDALRLWGLDEVLERSSAVWDARSSAYDLSALRARSHAGEVQVLTDAAGLGGFSVLEWFI